MPTGSPVRYVALARCPLMAPLNRRGGAGTEPSPTTPEPRVEQVPHGVAEHV